MREIRFVSTDPDLAKVADAANLLIGDSERDPAKWYELLAVRVEATDETGEHWLLPFSHPVRIWQKMKNWQPVISMRVIEHNGKAYFI
jgi:hypothetical protein